MSKIIATYNLDTNSWVVEDDTSASHCDLEFKFIKNNLGVVEFQNLTVEYKLYQSNIDVKIQSGEYSNVESDLLLALTLGNNISYRLEIIANNDGTSKTTTHNFVTSWHTPTLNS